MDKGGGWVVTGSNGERSLQLRYGSSSRAQGFYDNQMLTKLNDSMTEFISKRDMVFISTADAKGNCDTSFRAGDPGFVRVIDGQTLVYPEYRGNGVYASLGNIVENPHIGLLFIDFYESSVGLHVNGTAQIVDEVPDALDPRAERFVQVTVEEAYIHCSKHIPRLRKLDREIRWGTDDVEFKGGDFFRAKVTSAADKG